jgi:hypothetical protein
MIANVQFSVGLVGALRYFRVSTERQKMPRAHNLPKYVILDVDRYGTTRFYYRRAGRNKVRLPDDRNSAAFSEMYKALREGLVVVKVPPNPRPPSRPKLSTGYIYFLRTEQGIKIGFSEDPGVRIGALKTGMASPIQGLVVMPGTMKMERELHRMFAIHRKSGEWFREAPEITKAMAQAAAYGRVLEPGK